MSLKTCLTHAPSRAQVAPVRKPHRLAFLALMATTALGVAALASSPASAALIAAGSQIDFGGGISPIGGTDVYSSTGSDFRTSGSASIGIPGTIGITNTLGGDFSVFSAAACPSFVSGGCGTIADLLSYTVGTQTLNTPALPVADFVTFVQGAYDLTFDLTSFAITETQPTVSTLGTLTLSGAGTLHFAGYDDTPGIVTLTAQGPGSTSFSGSIVAQAVAVPEPASMLLLGAGLLGLGMVRRQSRRPG